MQNRESRLDQASNRRRRLLSALKESEPVQAVRRGRRAPAPPGESARQSLRSALGDVAEPAAPPQPPRPRRRDLMRRRMQPLAPVIVGVLLAFLILGAYNLATPQPTVLTQKQLQTQIESAIAAAPPPPPIAPGVFRAIAPSLVLIETEMPGAGHSEDTLGTGFVVDEGGSIMTSLHVVNDATAIKVTFADGSESAATIITKQAENDTAVLRAENPPPLLAPAILGDPSALRVGDDAYVVGNPFGLAGSLTTGVISGLGRSFRRPDSGQRLANLIQFDAAANPGNSGGPLLNRDGQVVGIVTAIMNPTDQNVFIGIGLAVPINAASSALGSPVD